jgi:hypothetical protein
MDVMADMRAGELVNGQSYEFRENWGAGTHLVECRVINNRRHYGTKNNSGKLTIVPEVPSRPHIQGIIVEFPDASKHSKDRWGFWTRYQGRCLINPAKLVRPWAEHVAQQQELERRTAKRKQLERAVATRLKKTGVTIERVKVPYRDEPTEANTVIEIAWSELQKLLPKEKQ